MQIAIFVFLVFLFDFYILGFSAFLFHELNLKFNKSSYYDRIRRDTRGLSLRDRSNDI